eukprot:s4526_g7.t1
MAHHLLDSVPKHLRFTPGGGSTRNLLLRNISAGELPLRIEPPGPPFLLSVGSEHVGKNFVLEAGATLAFRIAMSSAPQEDDVVCDFLTVHIECSPPLLIDIAAASDVTPSDEIASLIRDLVQKRSLHQSSAGNTPEAALVKPADAEERAVPAALLEFLGEAPSAAALRCHQPAVQTMLRPDTPDSGRGAYPEGPEAPLDWDDRPPTPSPEGFQQLGAPQELPRVQAPIESQASSWEMQEGDEESPLQPETFVAEKLPEVAPTAHLTPAEATRIAALRAKGLLQEDKPKPVLPVAEGVEPPRPAGHEDEDLFYIPGTGWCDIYGRAVEAFSPTSSAKFSPPRAARAAPKMVAKPAPKTRDQQQAAWDAIPGVQCSSSTSQDRQRQSDELPPEPEKAVLSSRMEPQEPKESFEVIALAKMPDSADTWEALRPENAETRPPSPNWRRYTHRTDSPRELWESSSVRSPRRSFRKLPAPSCPLLDRPRSRGLQRYDLDDERCQNLPAWEVENIRTSLRCGAYTGRCVPDQVAERLWRKLDVERRGLLSPDQFRRVVRLKLRVPASDVSDKELAGIFDMLAFEDADVMRIGDLVDYILADPPAPGEPIAEPWTQTLAYLGY